MGDYGGHQFYQPQNNHQGFNQQRQRQQSEFEQKSFNNSGGSSYIEEKHKQQYEFQGNQYQAGYIHQGPQIRQNEGGFPRDHGQIGHNAGVYPQHQNIPPQNQVQPDPRQNWKSDKAQPLPIDDILSNDQILESLMNENRELKKQSRNNNSFGGGFGNQQEEQRLRNEVSRLQRENQELQQRAASAASAPSYPPASMPNSDTAFFQREIQKLKQEKKKVEDEKRQIEEEKRKLETEVSSLRTGQYGKQMPNFSSGPQSSKLQEDLDNMKMTNQLLMEDNQQINDRLQSMEAEKKKVEAKLQSENEDLKREIANLRRNLN